MSTAFPGPDNQQPQNPYASAQQPMAPVQPEKKKGGCVKWGAAALGVLVVLGIVGSCGGGSDEEGTPATSSKLTENQVSSSAADTPAEADKPTNESVPAPAEQSEATPAAPAEEEKPAEKKVDDVPREYKNALRSAETYTKMSGFSYNGLYEQLTSEYGEGYPPEAAQYALDNLEVDWNEQALKSAKNYQEIMPMSDSGLFDQLTSEYGDGFTPEQAQYAIDHLDD